MNRVKRETDVDHRHTEEKQDGLTWASDAADIAGAISRVQPPTNKRIPERIAKLKADMERRRAFNRRSSTVRSVGYVMETSSDRGESVLSKR